MKRDCIKYVAKTKAFISYAVTVQLICIFIFKYSKSRFSHGMAQIIDVENGDLILSRKGTTNALMSTDCLDAQSDLCCLYEGRLINSRNSPLINSFLHQITRKLVYK